MNLKDLLVEAFALKDDEYNDNQSIMDLEQFDSMNHMLFITKLEDEFEIDLTGDEIAEIRTIGDVKNAMTAKGVENF